jgi:hypothetical protein
VHGMRDAWEQRREKDDICAFVEFRFHDWSLTCCIIRPRIRSVYRYPERDDDTDVGRAQGICCAVRSRTRSRRGV